MCSVLSFKGEDVAVASFEHVNGRLLIRIEDCAGNRQFANTVPFSFRRLESREHFADPVTS